MQVTVEDVSALTKRMKIVLPKDVVSKELDTAYRGLASEVNLKGFRKGKVPRKILEKNYRPKVEQEIGEKMIRETYFDALEKVKLDAVVHPEISSQAFGDDGTFTYEADIDIRPDFELGEYKGIEVELPETGATDAEVEAEITALRRQMAPLKGVEGRPVADDDLVIIDFQGYHDGEPMPQVRGENYSVEVGSGRNGKEFEEHLIGLEKGQETSKEIEFPASFANPVLAGKNVEFRITVKDIKEKALPELDDEFAQDVDAEFKTLDDLTAHLRDKITAEKESAQAGEFADKLMAKLLEKHDFEVPQRLVTYEVNELVKEMEERLKQQGLTLESAGLNRDQLVEQYREVAEKRVRGDFILKKIGEQEAIKVSQEDIDKGFERVAQQYRMTVEEVKGYFRNRDDLFPFMNELLNEKILAFLRDQATITRVAAEPEEAVASEAAGEEA